MNERSNKASFLIGFIFITAGILFLLSNLNLLDPQFTDAIFTWQMLLIAIGLIVFISSRDFFGILLIAIGSIFLIDKYYDFDVWQLWPVVLVLIGFQILFNSRKGAPENVNGAKNYSGKNWNETSQDFIYSENIFNSNNLRVTSENFKGGKISSIFGGMNLDLTHSKLSPGSNVLDVSNVFSGLEISVPSDWKIISEATQIFGGFEDKRKYVNASYDETKIMKLRGSSIFGGIKIIDVK